MTLPELQDHLCEVLNGRDWSLPFEAAPAYTPRVAYDAPGGNLQVFVFCRDSSSEVNDETAWTSLVGADIAITKRLSAKALKQGTENVAEIRPLMELVAEIQSFFKSADYEPPDGFRVEAVGNSPAYDPDALNAGRFVAPVQIDLFAAIEE